MTEVRMVKKSCLFCALILKGEWGVVNKSSVLKRQVLKKAQSQHITLHVTNM